MTRAIVRVIKIPNTLLYGKKKTWSFTKRLLCQLWCATTSRMYPIRKPSYGQFQVSVLSKVNARPTELCFMTRAKRRLARTLLRCFFGHGKFVLAIWNRPLAPSRKQKNQNKTRRRRTTTKQKQNGRSDYFSDTFIHPHRARSIPVMTSNVSNLIDFFVSRV